MQNFNDIDTILSKLLSIAGLDDRKKSDFINEFSSNLFKQTVGDLMQSLSEDTQAILIDKLSHIQSESDAIQIVDDYIGKEIFTKQLLGNYQQALIRLFKSIEVKLTPQQKDALTLLKTQIEQSVGKTVLESIRSEPVS